MLINLRSVPKDRDQNDVRWFHIIQSMRQTGMDGPPFSPCLKWQALENMCLCIKEEIGTWPRKKILTYCILRMWKKEANKSYLYIW